MGKITFTIDGLKITVDEGKTILEAALENGIYIPVSYSKGNYTRQSGLPEGTITIYSKKYGKSLPRGLFPQNESDPLTDYFEKDKARIKPGSKNYNEVSKFIK